MALDYTNSKAAVSMTGCRYPLSLCQEPLEASEKKRPETSQPEKLGHLLKVSYHEWKSLARHKGAEASVFWVRDTSVGPEGNRKDMNNEKLHALPESNYEKPTSGCTDVARFGEAALEPVREFLENNKLKN